MAQVKSQLIPIQYQGKTVNSFEIELPQKLDFVTSIFNEKFEINRIGTPKKIEQNYLFYQQIKLPKIASSFLDVYYQIEEIKKETSVVVKISMLFSKGYDNFITKESDLSTAQNILNLLNELGILVERKKFELQIMEKEQELLTEKQKLYLLEEDLSIIENERKEINKRIESKENVLRVQLKMTQDANNDLLRIKNALSEFEKSNSSKSKNLLNALNN
jgi:hypothetical protein